MRHWVGDMSIRDEIIKEARTYLETPFHHQARVKGVGIDCAGLIVAPLLHVGITVYDAPAYSRMPHGVLKPIIEKYCTKTTDPQPGDLYLFTYIHNQPQHLAWVTGKGMLHACARSKKVVEHGFDERWQKRLVATYRINGVDE